VEKQMRKELICLVIGLSMVIGCGSREKVIRVAPPSVVNQLRDVLQQIADAGMIDSSIEYAKELVEKAVEADPSKADLEQSVKELERAQGKKAISKKVEEMLTMLD
jgi:Tfp pilus assembly protein PilF